MTSKLSNIRVTFYQFELGWANERTASLTLETTNHPAMSLPLS